MSLKPYSTLSSVMAIICFNQSQIFCMQFIVISLLISWFLLAFFFFFSAFSYDLSHESVSSRSHLIFNHFPFKLAIYHVNTVLFGFIFSVELFRYMKTTLGNASIGKLLYSGVFLLSLCLRPYLPWNTACSNLVQFVLCFSCVYLFILILKCMRSSKQYQKKIFKKCLLCVPSPQMLPMETCM